MSDDIESALAEAIDDTYETDSDMRAAEIIEILAAKNIRLIDFSPGELQIGTPLQAGPSMRDMFAGEVFNALIRDNKQLLNSHKVKGVVRENSLIEIREMAEFSFTAADVMLEVRELTPNYYEPSPQPPQTEHVWSVKSNGSVYGVLAPNRLWYGSEAENIDKAVQEIKDEWAKNECADLVGFSYISSLESDTEFTKRAKPNGG